jgi:HD-GYP domain-containing protein (c-di-GMP phosphodiesterase class II)
MTSVRPYRLPVARDQALDQLRGCSGSQFDPDVVAAFCTAVRFAASEPWSAAAA